MKVNHHNQIKHEEDILLVANDVISYDAASELTATVIDIRFTL